jgi:hypothetical protein
VAAERWITDPRDVASVEHGERRFWIAGRGVQDADENFKLCLVDYLSALNSRLGITAVWIADLVREENQLYGGLVLYMDEVADAYIEDLRNQAANFVGSCDLISNDAARRPSNQSD